MHNFSREKISFGSGFHSSSPWTLLTVTLILCWGQPSWQEDHGRSKLITSQQLGIKREKRRNRSHISPSRVWLQWPSSCPHFLRVATSPNSTIGWHQALSTWVSGDFLTITILLHKSFFVCFYNLSLKFYFIWYKWSFFCSYSISVSWRQGLQWVNSRGGSLVKQ
jgi:hypothetical protein